MMRGTLNRVLGWAAQMFGDILESQLGTANMGLFILSMAGDQAAWLNQLAKIQEIHDFLNAIAPQLKAASPALSWSIDIQLAATKKIKEVLTVIQFNKPTQAEEDEYPTLPGNPDQWFQGPIG